jgi:site-specific DNA-methyltransferase (adenine-specific)
MELMKRFPDNHFDLAIVDPPYGIGEDGLKNHSRGKATKATKYTPKNWDKTPPNKEYFIELQRVSKNQIIFGANHFIENIPNANSSCWIVWDKDNTGDFADCELAWCSFDTAVRKIKWRWNGMLQQNMKDKQKRIHPTEKPYGLYQWIFTQYAKEGYSILDTHFGSGSIAIALDSVNKIEKMNLTLTACEIEKDYFKNAVNRIKEETKWESLF